MAKKKYVLLTAVLLTLSLAAGCGSKAGTTDAGKTEVQESQTTTSEASEAQEDEIVAATEEQNAASTDAEEKTVTGTIDEIKDFMFVVTDENGTAYGFDFETKPEGLDNVENGDTVTVTYTGTVSEIDPFNGTIISVEKQN